MTPVAGGRCQRCGTGRTLFEQTRPDIVYILTSDSRGGPDLDFVQASVQNDVMATINVLVEATRHKCRHVVMTGSMDEPDGMARSATPSTPYGAAKWVLGGYARMFMRLYGTPISILRPMMTYGPGQKSYKLIPSIIDALLQDKGPNSAAESASWIGSISTMLWRHSFEPPHARAQRNDRRWQRQARQRSRLRFADRQPHGPLASAGVRS